MSGGDAARIHEDGASTGINGTVAICRYIAALQFDAASLAFDACVCQGQGPRHAAVVGLDGNGVAVGGDGRASWRGIAQGDLFIGLQANSAGFVSTGPRDDLPDVIDAALPGI